MRQPFSFSNYTRQICRTLISVCVGGYIHVHHTNSCNLPLKGFANYFTYKYILIYIYTCGLVAAHLSFAQTSRVGRNRKHIWALNFNNFCRPAQNPSLPLWLCMCRLLAGRAVGYVFAVCLAMPFAGFPACWRTMPLAVSLLFVWRCRLLVFPDDAFGYVFAVCLALPFAGFPAGWRRMPLRLCLCAIYYRCYSKFAMCLPPVY